MEALIAAAQTLSERELIQAIKDNVAKCTTLEHLNTVLCNGFVMTQSKIKT